MRKLRTIAWREYLSTVRTKGFILTILLMPVVIGTSIGLQVVFKKLDDAKEKRYAVIDRTPDRELGKFLQVSMEALQLARAKDPKLAVLVGTKAAFVLLEPGAATPEAMAEQRFQVSRQIEKGEFEALIEIGANVLEVRPGVMFPNPDKVDDHDAVRFQAKNIAALRFRKLVEVIVNQGVQMQRLRNKGLSPLEIAALQQPVAMKPKALTQRDVVTGKLADARDETEVLNLLLPGAVVGLMFLILTVGATPAINGVIEEKSQRIAEVLLGSVTPFQLMAGKLLGLVGVSLTMASVYLGGAYFLAAYFGVADALPVTVLLWLVPMLVLAMLIFGSLFIAVGAAATNLKDAQSLLLPIMLFAGLPMFALLPIIEDPNGPIARVCSFIPFATPMLLVARQSVPPGVPWWEMAAGTALVLATTLVCVWTAGRIFRVGILMQGKGPNFTDMLRWAVKG